MSALPRIVLDTNIVLSALLFGGSQAARIRTGWQSRRFLPLASAVTARELVRALAYPKFRLSPAEQAELLADYLPWVQVTQIPDPPPSVPRCRDPFDAPFLVLSRVGGAQALVSGDGDLLALAGSPGLCSILTMGDFCLHFLDDGPSPRSSRS